MTFLPVVERELRVASRRRASHLVRVAAASIGLGTTAWILMFNGGSTQEAGANLFKILAVFLFMYAGLFGSQITADCMSEEKREGTLGLLFLTDLKGYDVVLGKLTATSLNSFYGMLAVVPILAIPLLMGGVSEREMLRVVVALVNLLFFSLCVGLWASAVCRRESRAHVLSAVVALAIMFAWPVETQLKRHPNPNPRLANLSSPAYGCVVAFDEVYKLNPPGDFWLNAAVTQFYSWVFLGLACWLAPRSWQDVAVQKSWWLRWRRASFNNSKPRTKLLELEPFLWRASRPEFKGVAVWLLLSVLVVLWLWTTWYSRGTWARNGFEPPVDLAFLVCGGLMVKALLAGESGRALGEDRRSGAFELLLCTRLQPDQIVRGQQWALWRQFALPIGFLLAANLFSLLIELRPSATWDKEDRLTMICLHIILGAFLIGDSIALSWAGMWHGFIARKPNRSALPTMLRIVVMPGLLFFLLVSLFSAGGAKMELVGLLTFWCVLGIFTDIFALLDRERLLAQFATIAAEGYRRGRAVELRPEPIPDLAEAS